MLLEFEDKLQARTSNLLRLPAHHLNLPRYTIRWACLDFQTISPDPGFLPRRVGTEFFYTV